MICTTCWKEGWMVRPETLSVRSSRISGELTPSVNCIVPIVCYLMQGEHPLPESVIRKYRDTGGELCKNVFLLSEPHRCSFLAIDDAVADKSGILKTANGIKIACLGGSYDPEIYATAEAAPVSLPLCNIARAISLAAHCECFNRRDSLPPFSVLKQQRGFSRTPSQNRPQRTDAIPHWPRFVPPRKRPR
jgi:hypothetical protein